MKKFLILAGCFVLSFSFFGAGNAEAAYHFSNFKGRPPIHILGGATKTPVGMTPAQIKSFYNLPAAGGHGTIVVVGAYDDKTIENDLSVFSKQFSLPLCTTTNGCFAKHPMTANVKANSGWAMETSLDIEWAHAIAPNAKILLVEATTPSGANLLKAVDYAASVKDASAISMSWGGAEFPEELSLDSHFQSVSGAPFFASSGDNGAGASWPAASPNVIGVGGTTISLKSGGSFSKETAWSGSGGGVSAYEKEPSFQNDYSIPKAGGMRAIPDVSYDADPSSGFPIIHSGKWFVVGGTSAGSPQWAAIAALGNGLNIANLYADKNTANNVNYFRDITYGANGDCGYYCSARAHYDYVTGLGSPLTDNF
jgi:subtilase family serine protease